jgi:hypothetical protein
MAVFGLSPSAEKKYVLKADPCRGPNGEPVEGSTVFHIKTLTGRDMALVRDAQFELEQSEEGARVKMRIPQGIVMSMRLGLVGWTNFLDPETDEPIPFETVEENLGGENRKVPTQRVLDMIDPNHAAELANEINVGAKVSKAETGKSAGASSPGKSTPSGTAEAAQTPSASSGGAARVA